MMRVTIVDRCEHSPLAGPAPNRIGAANDDLINRRRKP
jgi:hypothetical protein